MKNQNVAFLEAVDWKLYLKREWEYFLIRMFDRPYGSLLREITGFGFYYDLIYSKEGICHWYRSARELKMADEHFASLISSSDPRIAIWLEKESECHKKIDAIGDTEDISEKMRILEEILLYNTVIPYRLLSAIQHVKGDDNIRRKLENIRKESLYPAIMHEIFSLIFEQVSSKLNVPKHLAEYLTPEELLYFYEGRTVPDEEILRRRREGIYIFREGEEFQEAFSNVDFLQENPEDIEAVNGVVASPGIVMGRARIVNTISQISKVEKGDIMISINTNPSLMPAIEKCAGIVTDEGGITCHAAVISREFKIPCIIGTKHATRLFKDGDMVEVDTDKGVVRKV